MKKLIIAFVLSSIAPITMTARDVLYLKNGSVIKGEIIELNMGGNVKIQTSDGSLFVYESNQVEKIGKEQTESQAPVKPSVEQPKTAELKTELKAEEKSADRHFRHKGYRGFADFGGLLGLNRAFDFDFYSALMFSTSQGFQICPWVFIGAGVGVNIYNYSYSNTDCFGNGDCEPKIRNYHPIHD